MDSFNWLDYIDFFHKYANPQLNCSYRVGSYIFGSYLFGSYSIGSYQIGSFQQGSFLIGSYDFGSFDFGSYMFDFIVNSMGEPLNLFGYGIDLI